MIQRIGKGFEIDKKVAEFKKVKSTAPRIIGNDAKNHFLEGFRKGGRMTDDSRSGWIARRQGTPNSGGRALLVKSGALRRSIGVKMATWERIIVASIGVKYANIHNEGGTIKITEKMKRFFWAKYYQTEEVFWKGLALAKSFYIPKREFIGDSKVLRVKIKNKISLLIKQSMA